MLQHCLFNYVDKRQLHKVTNLLSTDWGGRSGEDCGCQVQDVWLRLSHRLQLPGNRVGEGQICKWTFCTHDTSSVSCFTVLSECCISQFKSFPPTLLVCSFCYISWLDGVFLGWWNVALLAFRLMKHWPYRTRILPKSSVFHRSNFTALVSSYFSLISKTVLSQLSNKLGNSKPSFFFYLIFKPFEIPDCALFSSAGWGCHQSCPPWLPSQTGWQDWGGQSQQLRGCQCYPEHQCPAPYYQGDTQSIVLDPHSTILLYMGHLKLVHVMSTHTTYMDGTV